MGDKITIKIFHLVSPEDQTLAYRVYEKVGTTVFITSDLYTFEEAVDILKLRHTAHPFGNTWIEAVV